MYYFNNFDIFSIHFDVYAQKYLKRTYPGFDPVTSLRKQIKGLGFRSQRLKTPVYFSVNGYEPNTNTILVLWMSLVWIYLR